MVIKCLRSFAGRAVPAAEQSLMIREEASNSVMSITFSCAIVYLDGVWPQACSNSGKSQRLNWSAYLWSACGNNRQSQGRLILIHAQRVLKACMQQVYMQWGHLQTTAFVRNTGKHNARLSVGHYLMVTESVIPASACPRLGMRLGMVLPLAVTQ